MHRVSAAIAVFAAIGFTSPLLAQPRSPRPSPVMGPLPLPILAALPARDDASFYSVKEVPHGVLEQPKYKDVAGNEKRMHVYLPPGYAECTNTYPVLYLNHGGGDDGGHDWPNWRRYLWQTAQVMFPGSKEPALKSKRE